MLGDIIVDTLQRLEEMALRSTNERILLLLLRQSETHSNVQPVGWITLGWGFLTMAICMLIYVFYSTFTEQINYESSNEKATKQKIGTP